MENSNQNPTGPMPTEYDIPAPTGEPAPLPLGEAPASSSVQTPPQATGMVTSRPKRGFPKALLAMLLLIMLIVIGAFAVIRFIVPNLGGDQKLELVWWGLWEDSSLVQPLIDEYQAANPGVTIKYEKKDKEDYRERLTSALAREDGPDIFRIHNTWVPMYGQELSVLPTGVMSAQEFQNTFYPVAVADLVGARGPVAIPLEFDGLAMFINEDIFTTYSATIPTDWNDLRQTAKALTIKDERGVITQSGASVGTVSNVDHWPEIVALMMLQNGANPNTPADAAGRGSQALRFYKQFAETDGVWDDTLPESTVAFATGRVAMYFGPSWRAFEIKERNPSLNFRVVPVPQLPKPTPETPDITYASYWVEGVSSKSEAQEEAWKFLKFMSQRESLEKLYQNMAQARLFGEPYSRTDMRELLLTDPLVGGFLKLAPTAKSGYLASRTFDGASGINTSMAQYYADAIAAISPSREDPQGMATLASGVLQVLVRYGLASPPPPTEK